MDKNKKDDIEIMSGEDVTKYGEFVTSYFAWIGLDKQKEKVDELENIEKKNKRKRLIAKVNSSLKCKTKCQI